MTEASMEDIRGWVEDGAIAPDARALARESEAAQDELARTFQRLFSSLDGQKVLEALAAATVRRPAVDHRLTGHDYVAYAQLRQGQDQVFALIVHYLNQAERLDREHLERSRTDQQRDPAGGAGKPVSHPDAGFDPAGAVRVI